MADKKDGDNGQKRQKRTNKVIYIRCFVCGGRKKQEDTIGASSGVTAICVDCSKKQGFGSYWDGRVNLKNDKITSKMT